MRLTSWSIFMKEKNLTPFKNWIETHLGNSTKRFKSLYLQSVSLFWICIWRGFFYRRKHILIHWIDDYSITKWFYKLLIRHVKCSYNHMMKSTFRFASLNFPNEPITSSLHCKRRKGKMLSFTANISKMKNQKMAITIIIIIAPTISTPLKRRSDLF